MCVRRYSQHVMVIPLSVDKQSAIVSSLVSFDTALAPLELVLGSISRACYFQFLVFPPNFHDVSVFGRKNPVESMIEN